MTGLSEDQRANFQLMKALGSYTRQEPKKRMETLLKFSQRIHSQPEIKTDLEAWGLKFSNELESFKGRVLPPEKILGGKTSSTTYQLENADWSKCFRKWESFRGESLTKWAVIFGPKDEAQTKEFLTSLTKVAPSLGMVIKAPKMFKMADTRAATYLATLDQVFPAKPQLVMLVVPNNKGDQYAAIKKKCCLDVPTPSQVVTATVLNKPKGLMSVATKVAIQVRLLYSIIMSLKLIFDVSLDELQAWRRALGCEDAVEEHDGHRVRYLPRHCQQGQVGGRRGGQPQPVHDEVHQHCQPPHYPRAGAPRQPLSGHRDCSEEIPAAQ